MEFFMKFNLWVLNSEVTTGLILFEKKKYLYYGPFQTSYERNITLNLSNKALYNKHWQSRNTSFAFKICVRPTDAKETSKTNVDLFVNATCQNNRTLSR